MVPYQEMQYEFYTQLPQFLLWGAIALMVFLKVLQIIRRPKVLKFICKALLFVPVVAVALLYTLLNKGNM